MDFISEIIQSTFSSLTPLILGLAIYSKNYQYFLYFAGIYILLEVLNRYFFRLRAIYLIQAEHSLNYSAYKFFLTVDPIFHTTKSSGQIIAKVERSTSSYGQMVNMFLGELIFTVVSFVSIIITLTAFNLKLGLIAVITFVILSIINAILSFINAKSLSKRAMQAQDSKSMVCVETLQQNALIRSSFASTEQDSKIQNKTINLMNQLSIRWLGGGVAVSLNRFLFLISTMALSVTILDLVQTYSLDSVTAITLLVTFLNSSRSVLKVGALIRDLTQKYMEVTDLFNFIRNFGKQTYPVLKEDSK